MPRRLLLVLVALLLALAGCKVDTTVTVKVRDDGSGVVSVTAVLDPDAVKAAEVGGGKLEDRVRLGDLTKAGWTLEPWVRAPDGSARITFSKPFSSPSEVAGIVKELNGTAGPLRDVTATRDKSTFSTNYSAKGTLDLSQLQTGLTADQDVVGSLLGQRVDVNGVDQQLLADLKDALGLHVKVELPGKTVTIDGVNGQTSAIDESTSVLDTTRVILVTVAVVLVVLAVVVLLWPGRRRRRVNRRRAPATTRGSAPGTRAQSWTLPPAAHPPDADPS
jgi:hypothetical protein